MKRRYSSESFVRFWKKKNRADERRRLRDIRLPFSRKMEILGELMEEAIFLSRLKPVKRSSRAKRRRYIRGPVIARRRRTMREKIRKAA